MAEDKCAYLSNRQSSDGVLNDQRRKALVAPQRTLSREHHDFFSASQHPTVFIDLRKLADKHAMPAHVWTLLGPAHAVPTILEEHLVQRSTMPARMWRHGIHTFLEPLRHRFPDPLEHMLSFIYLACSMMILLKESVPSFVETWIECLGDLARYRMVMEDADHQDRDTWSYVAKIWYNEAADKSPNVGRIQHYLAALARPNIVDQFFYYEKALVTVVPFTNARDSIMLLLDSFQKKSVSCGELWVDRGLEDIQIATCLALLSVGCAKELGSVSDPTRGEVDYPGDNFKMQGPETLPASLAAISSSEARSVCYWVTNDNPEASRMQICQLDSPLRGRGNKRQPPEDFIVHSSTSCKVLDSVLFSPTQSGDTAAVSYPRKSSRAVSYDNSLTRLPNKMAASILLSYALNILSLLCSRIVKTKGLILPGLIVSSMVKFVDARAIDVTGVVVPGNQDPDGQALLWIVFLYGLCIILVTTIPFVGPRLVNKNAIATASVVAFLSSLAMSVNKDQELLHLGNIVCAGVSLGSSAWLWRMTRSTKNSILIALLRYMVSSGLTWQSLSTSGIGDHNSNGSLSNSVPCLSVFGAVVANAIINEKIRELYNLLDWLWEKILRLLGLERARTGAIGEMV